MRLFLLSNSTDTLTGMRLAGVEGIFADSPTAAADALEGVIKDGNIAAVLMNKSLFDLCGDVIKEFSKLHPSLLITQIPDRGGAL